jgi:hypothetical protein
MNQWVVTGLKVESIQGTLLGKRQYTFIFMDFYLSIYIFIYVDVLLHYTLVVSVCTRLIRVPWHYKHAKETHAKARSFKHTVLGVETFQPTATRGAMPWNMFLPLASAGTSSYPPSLRWIYCNKNTRILEVASLNFPPRLQM